MAPTTTMIVNTNVKGYSPDIDTPVGRFNLIIGPNESHKTALALAMTLPFTGMASDELYRASVSGRTLKALRAEGDEEVFSIVKMGAMTLAEWRQKGGGNPKISGEAGGKLTDVWTTVCEGAVGYAPKLAIMLLDSPRGKLLATKEQQKAREALSLAEAEHKRVKGSDPGAIPAMPPDPREAAVNCFRALESGAKSGIDCQALRRDVAEQCALLARWKEGQRIAEAKLAFDKALAAAKAVVDAKKDELVRVTQPLADALAAEADKFLAVGRKIIIDLTGNDIYLINKGVKHLAPSGTLEAWMHMALGSVLFGGQGALVIPDLQWDGRNVAAWMNVCGSTDFAIVTLTLATSGKKIPGGDAWNVIKLGA